MLNRIIREVYIFLGLVFAASAIFTLFYGVSLLMQLLST